MKNSTLLLATLAASAPAVASLGIAPPAEKVVFAPKEGVSLTKTFETEMQYTLDDMNVLMNGEEAPFMGQMEMDMETVQTIAVTDKYVRMAEGRPAVLERTFDDVGMEMQMDMSMEVMGQTQDQSPEGSGTSGLEGSTVVFTWNEEEGSYDVAYPEGVDEDEALLAGLLEDMDLRGLLPSGEVAVGDTWDIELKKIADVLAPGGDLKLDIEVDGAPMGGGGMDPQMMSNMREYFGDLLEGQATGTLTEIREADGARIAVITLEIEVDTTADLSELMNAQMDEQMPDGMEVSLDRADIEFSIDCKGTLLWNLTAGHLHSLDLEGDSGMAMDMEMAMDMGGQAMDLETSMEMSGTLKTSVRTE